MRSLPPVLIAIAGVLLIGCLALGGGGLLLYRTLNGGDGTRNPTTRPTPAPVAGLGDVVALAAGTDHSLALAREPSGQGSVWAWGGNQYGQLGVATAKECGGNTLNAFACSPKPVRVPGLAGATAIAAGANHNLSLVLDPAGQGRVWAWGWNQSGQLGDGTTADRLAPAPLHGLPNIVAIAAGGGHSLALDATGALWQWGNDLAGTTACQPPGWSTSFPCSLAPTRVANLAGATAIAAGSSHSLALLRESSGQGIVLAWGGNEHGQLGDGTTAPQATPVRLANLSGVSAIAAGRDHSLALSRESSGQVSVRAWGNNQYGQLGIASRDACPGPPVGPCSLTPVLLTGQSLISAIAGGDGRTLLLRQDGTVLWLGAYDPDDATGFGSAADACELTPPTTSLAHCKAHPTLVANLTNATAIAVGGQHYLVLVRTPDNRGTVWAWGDNYSGQVGPNTR